MLGEATRQLMEAYPKIYFACHTRHVADPAAKRVLSAHQASILDHLDDHDATTVGELARHMGVTPGTMSIAVDRLERKGFVRRSRDRDDARRVGLTLTPAGSRIRSAKSVLDAERVRAMLSRLNDDERDRAIAGLELLAEAAQREMHTRQLYGLRRSYQRATGRKAPS